MGMHIHPMSLASLPVSTARFYFARSKESGSGDLERGYHIMLLNRYIHVYTVDHEIFVTNEFSSVPYDGENN